MSNRQIRAVWFQHTAARRRLNITKFSVTHTRGFNTQPPEGGWESRRWRQRRQQVSTHSRPKAAEPEFNEFSTSHKFQHTAARRRLRRPRDSARRRDRFNTQPPEGGWLTKPQPSDTDRVSTHSRPKAAARMRDQNSCDVRFQHTAARRRLVIATRPCLTASRFQHTAARRRLPSRQDLGFGLSGFNTQPPEGGWADSLKNALTSSSFQHTAARRRLSYQDAFQRKQ